ncbi:hypothetical protein LCGC14_1832430 [marine sediment metagenome]|uniref:Uncharacterized protein n=1 Tax=marine sediment metagenome TaxID=412755 RepID=A0A0F9JF66_9ZZZZ
MPFIEIKGRRIETTLKEDIAFTDCVGKRRRAGVPGDEAREQCAVELGLIEAETTREEGKEGSRRYTDAEIAEITGSVHDTVARETSTVIAGFRPMYTKFEHLPAAQLNQALEGMKQRIENEGLEGYIARKRKDWGDGATNAALQELKRKGLL